MTDIFNMEEEFNALIKAGQQLIEKLKKEQVVDATETKRWKPKVDEGYHCVLGHGVININVWVEDVTDCGYYKLGNCFKTEEEAQKELDRRIAEQELLELADWDDDIVYCIVYNQISESFDINLHNNFIPTPYRFASEESCKKAIDTLGIEKLKLIFRID